MWPKCRYMVKQIAFSSFDHPFQDGYKSSVIQILFPWLVQGGYLNYLLRYFLYARIFTKSWCSVGMFFDRCTNCKFINWYPDMTLWILVQCTVFLTEKNLNYYHIGRHFWRVPKWVEISASEEPNALEGVPVQFMALRKLSGKAPVQFIPFQKLSGKIHFLVWFYTSNWKRTYVMQYG